MEQKENREYAITINMKIPGEKKRKKEELTGIAAFQKNVSDKINFFKNNVVFKEFSGIVDKTISYHVSNIGLTTGNSESQARAEFTLNAINKGAIFAGSLLTGNYIGAALMVVNEAVSIGFRQSQINLEQSIENESLALSRQRAGIAFNQSRINGRN